ncbi:MAG TPA: hypothetical protein VLX58_07720 [Bryobacteraceae bacterium]|nr:hypothetical protein [Bryobacteraceae bacterium]
MSKWPALHRRSSRLSPHPQRPNDIAVYFANGVVMGIGKWAAHPSSQNFGAIRIGILAADAQHGTRSF